MNRLTACLAATALWPMAVAAAPVLDQESWASPSAAVSASFEGFRRAMSFTAGRDGALVRIEVATVEPPASGSSLALLGTEAGVPGGAPLAIGAYAGTVAGVSAYDFAGFAQRAGQELAIELRASGTRWLVSGEGYAGGESFSWFPGGGETGFTANGLDLLFRSFVEPAAVPAPAGAALLGLFALLALRHETITRRPLRRARAAA
jgi:hypothetical protein